MVAILILHTSNFIVSDPTKFSFIWSIPEVMLTRVPQANVVITEYWKLPPPSSRSMTNEIWTALEEANKPKKGGKRKGEAGPSEEVKTSKKKVKKSTRTLKSPFLVQKASESRTQSDIREREAVQNEIDDTTATSEPLVSEPMPIDYIPKVPSPITITISFSESFQVPSPPPSSTNPSSTHYFCPNNYCTFTKDICGCNSTSNFCSPYHTFLHRFHHSTKSHFFHYYDVDCQRIWYGGIWFRCLCSS